MRYFIYLSGSKVEMLYRQLPHGGARTSSTIGFDLRVVKGDRKVEHSQPSIYDKLQAVEDQIYTQEPVGSVDSPAAWISFRGEVLAANFTSNSDAEPKELRNEAVLFSLISETGARTLLGGSGHHLAVNADLASPRGERLYFSWSVPLMNLLGEYSAEIESRIDWDPDRIPAREAAHLIHWTALGWRKVGLWRSSSERAMSSRSVLEAWNSTVIQ